MSIARHAINRAAMFAVFSFLALLLSHKCLGQGGPPPLPPIPTDTLDFWPLEQPDWSDWYSDPARGFTNLNVVQSWDYTGTTLSVDTNVPAFLNYDVVQDGYTNIVFDAGSISLWFQPNWTSTTDGGNGPTNWAVLLSLGNWTSNSAASAWTIAISPSGTNLLMEAQSNGLNQVVFNVPIDFDAWDWHSLTMTYSLTNCCVYLEGQLVTNMGPIDYYPTSGDSTNYGFFVGSISTSGMFQCHGQLQWLSTYNYPLNADAVATDYADTSSYIRYFGGSLPGSGFHPDAGGPPGLPGGGTNSGGDYPEYEFYASFTPPPSISTTDYAAYNQFYLSISNSPSLAYVTACNTLSNITYEVLTNSNLSVTNGWHVWHTFVATNSVTPLPSISLASNALYFEGVMVWSTCTTYNPALPDWWAMLYFNSTACVNPAANPSGDGIDNWDKFTLRLNPNIAYVSQLIVSPPGGDYVATPSVSIFSLAGASIKYTTNGTTPSATNGTTVASGVVLTNLPTGSFTLKAWESGLVSNVPISEIYTIIAGTPVISLPEGVYASGTTLHISCPTPGAVVRYTTNGVDPTTSSTQIQPTNLITLTTNVTIKAAAWLNGTASPVADASYIVEGPPANDNFSNAIVLSGPSGQFFGTTVASTIESFEISDPDGNFDNAAGSGNSVWYKWTAPSNGTVFLDWSKSSQSYYGLYISVYYFTNSSTNPSNLQPVTLTYESDNTSQLFSTTQNTAYYFSISDFNLTGPFDLSWEYVQPSDPPLFTPGTSTNLTALLVGVFDNDANAVIRYTTNGSAPATNSSVVMSGGTLLISQTTTLKAAAWRAGLEESAINTAIYTVNASATNPTVTASAPVISPTNQIFASSITLTLTCTNAGSVVYYTLNGTMPSTASASVSSGGTVTITNSAIVNATAWVTNMNLSPITTGLFAKEGVDTADDGIPDTSMFQISANFLTPDAGAANTNAFAHGLNNMQVYESPSVLNSNNYSTLNDGIPDWWLVQNGYSVTTPTNALGANGQTLLTSYVAGLNPNSASSQPGQLPPIDFRIVHGPSNSLVMVLDTINPSVVSYFLTCVPINTSTGSQAGASVMEQFDADDAIKFSGLATPGRYFQLTNALCIGNWLFTLQGVSSNSLWSTTSSNTFTANLEVLDFYGGSVEYDDWYRYSGLPIPVVGYTNLNSVKESLLIQLLRAESDIWVDDTPFGNVTASGPVVYDYQVPSSVTSETSWGTVEFQYESSSGSYYPLNYASYYTAICSTPDSPFPCDDYSFPAVTLGPLQITYDSNDNPWFYMPSEAFGGDYNFNPAGLQYLSVTYRIAGDTPVTLTPGQSNALPAGNFTFEVALQTATPTLRTVAYAFDGRDYPVTETENSSDYSSSTPPGPYTGWSVLRADGWLEGPGPGGGPVIPTAVTNAVIVAQVGVPLHLQAWSEVMAVTNGTPITNQLYGIDRDFAQAYLCDPATGDVPRTSATNYDGSFMINTNTAVPTGILSPNLNYPYNANYWFLPTRSADFTPTQTGKVIVTTLPDANGFYGEVTIYIIDMQVDDNHDGVMDNRDLTSPDNPMQFWVNNNYDRYVLDSDDGVSYDDDVASTNPAAASPGTPGMPTPDYNYMAFDLSPQIPNTRDLEDYARLWIPGLSSMVTNLPTNYTVTLQWRNNTGAAMRLFKASETNGGTNYLFNSDEASNQVNYLSYPCYGYVSPNDTVSLSSAFGSSSVPRPSDYFIFCGAAIGNDELVCQVRTPWGGVAGEASVFINLKDIKQMYERWTVGDNPNVNPLTAASIATNNLPPSGSFQYPYYASLDATTPYILYVHGWNMETWIKDRWAETTLKRLYWQGYQGRIGSFRWPTDNGFTATWVQLALNPTEKDNFDGSEYQAWQSGAGLLNTLISLNEQYPGQIYVLGHSMGNVVAGEALRLAGTDHVVNTYVASQAAVTAHTYDATVPDYSFSYSPYSLSADTPNIYGDWFATNDGGGAGQVINFYNVNDYALQRSAWQLDQLLKPDQSVYENGASWNYGYNGYTNDPSPWNHFFKTNTYARIGTNLNIVSDLNNRYEAMAYAAQAYTTALGATPAVGNVSRNVNLARPTPPIWPPDPTGNNYTEHFWHSAEFRGDYWQLQGYWSELLGSDAFNLK